ncbi:hypothetical protein SAMN05660776_0928 [Salegentibacter holothuriorum]|uniref:Uncharacterized protein n=1 Tax=Salegentibacter holothuriorum TaxID=241145 RepID=A0A1T5AX99_9FLAO|nr:hypothetical protein [Salegentibacter holothuriorum]SKB39439.1 hypothetical protein SAMN05660776_0928 [Salegentibacter holothuriorum]
MNTFSNLKELLRALQMEEKLLSEMFVKRKSLVYRYDFALEMVDYKEEKIQFLIDHSVIYKNGDYLELDTQYLDFFENVLGVNEEINTSYINENIRNVRENINYLLNEKNEIRRYNYLRFIKNTFKKIALSTFKNVVDLRRNIDTTFKNEPNYKNKKAKLENLDRKRLDILDLIYQTENLISSEEKTFFKAALDEELNNIIIQLKRDLIECSHNLIETEKQIIEFLNQIKYQSGIIEKLRKIKYLKDQFIIKDGTDIIEVLSQRNLVVFEKQPTYPVKLSPDFLATDEGFEAIKRISGRIKTKAEIKIPVAENISRDQLDTQIQEEVLINLEEVKNNFMATGNNLFNFLMNYNFLKEVSFPERVTLYCQLISQYEEIFEIISSYETFQDIEYTLVYPKTN